jgi:murein DD-endopeptidase MepM/ murein hydrolase activator NlpD
VSNSYHPGEDWNIPGAGNGDWGEPVYAIANGEVVFSGWNSAMGNVVLIKHNLSRTEAVWSQYAHLDVRMVKTGDMVTRRQQIGTVGRGPNNRFAAHLHFEIRKADLPANAWPRTNGEPWGSERVKDYWLNPSLFIQQNRPW